MILLIRAAGERTENECRKSCKAHGTPEFIRAVPFGESIRQTYIRGLELSQKWIPVIDADVILYRDCIKAAIRELDKLPDNIFCLDGRTLDKIFMETRRAGVHIYRRDLLERALEFIDSDYIKPESRVRERMAALGYPTHVGKIVFGRHDYEQYYRDLWRKSVAQVFKLGGKFNRHEKRIVTAWKRLSLRDKDYAVILAAHNHGKKYSRGEITIDVRNNYGADEGLQRLKLKEKGPMK